MEFKIKYYKDLVSFHIPDQNVLGNILPNTAPAAVRIGGRSSPCPFCSFWNPQIV